MHTYFFYCGFICKILFQIKIYLRDSSLAVSIKSVLFNGRVSSERYSVVITGLFPSSI